MDLRIDRVFYANGIEAAVGHQTKQLETIVGSLEKSVDRSLTESAAVKKEASDNNRALTTWYICGVWAAVGLFLAIVVLVLGVYRHISGLNEATNKDIKEFRQEVRSDFSQLQRSFESEIAKITKTKQP